MKSISWCVVVCGMLCLMSCDRIGEIEEIVDITYSWELPNIPIKFSYSRNRGVSVSVSSSLRRCTSIGVFSIEYTYDIERNRAFQNSIRLGNVDVYKQDMLVVIRNRKRKKNQDEMYYIKNGRFLNVNADGRTNIQVRDGLVIIDVTNVDNLQVEFSPQSAKAQYVIAYRLSRYYKNIALNRHEDVGKMYAEKVDRYYNLRNITRRQVVEQIKGYDNMFDVYSKDFDVDWGSLDVEEAGDKYIVSYLIKYQIDRRDKNLPTYFEIRMYLKMNKRYEIIDIYEQILKRGKVAS